MSISNFITAVTKHALNGFTEVPQQEYLQRLKICGRCPYKTTQWKCTQCGCFLTIKAKWQSEDCPIDNWPKRQPLQVVSNDDTSPLPNAGKACGC